MFKILSTDICWINIKWGIWRVILRPSYIWDARFLKVNILNSSYFTVIRRCTPSLRIIYSVTLSYTTHIGIKGRPASRSDWFAPERVQAPTQYEGGWTERLVFRP